MKGEHVSSVTNTMMKKPSRNKGQSLVELAILLPLLVLIIFGVLDLGRAFFSLITITNAARAGARMATFDTNIPTSAVRLDTICNAAVNEASLSSIRVKKEKMSIQCGDSSGVKTLCTGSSFTGCPRQGPIIMNVGYDFTLLTGIILGSPTIEMNRSVQMMMP